MQDQRDDIIGVTLALDAAGMVPNKSGNVSCRVAEGFAITPAGIPYRELQPGDIVALPLDGPLPPLGQRPSSEWRMHAAIYRARPDVAAIVHTHSPRATALACAGRGIPAVPLHDRAGRRRRALHAVLHVRHAATGRVGRARARGPPRLPARQSRRHGGGDVAGTRACRRDRSGEPGGRVPVAARRRPGAATARRRRKSRTSSTGSRTTVGWVDARAAGASDCPRTGPRNRRRRTAAAGSSGRAGRPRGACAMTSGTTACTATNHCSENLATPARQ